MLARQYDEMIASTRREMSHIVRMWNAQYLSRIGFTLQDIRNSVKEYTVQINERAENIGEEQECVVRARDELVHYADTVGNNVGKSIEMARNSLYVYKNLVYYYLGELGTVIDDFRLDMFNWLSKKNPMTNFEAIEEAIRTEYQLIEILFEMSVDEILDEIQQYMAYVQLSQAEVFENLFVHHGEFRFQGNGMIRRLYLCNATISE